MTTKKSSLAVVGFGKMATAIVQGMISSKTVAPKSIAVLAHRPAKDKSLKKKFGLTIIESPEDLMAAKVILLAVKPQQMESVLKEIAPHIKKQLVITVAAGLPLSFYQKHLGKNAPIIRVMPNTPSFLGLGASGYYCHRTVTSSQKKLFEKYFKPTGLLVELKKESLIDAVISVSGSGPAFLYLYAQAVMENGAKLGLNKKQARDLTLQTLKGATEMLIQTKLEPQKLIDQVTSKGGTTLAGLEILKKNKFTSIIQKCMNQAAKRSKEISQLFGR